MSMIKFDEKELEKRQMLTMWMRGGVTTRGRLLGREEEVEFDHPEEGLVFCKRSPLTL